MLEQLKEQVYQANQDLVRHGLVVLTWGNVSGIDRQNGIMAIKPSGVSYEDMKPSEIVMVDLDGKVVEGGLSPSSDTATHLALYRAFEGIGGISHTHSVHATMFAQARQEIPCFGTTHADFFYGPVPVTRPLTKEEVEGEYEAATGRVIIERFAGLDPVKMPAVLAARHGAFTWGLDAAEAVRNAVALEEVARMALGTQQISAAAEAVPGYLLDKHYLRKHGSRAYYGQK